MNQREIPRKDWPEFLESFGRRHRSWLATVEEWPREAPERTRAVDQPLESLGAEDGAIAIHLGAGEVLRVEAPRAVTSTRSDCGASTRTTAPSPRWIAIAPSCAASDSSG